MKRPVLLPSPSRRQWMGAAAGLALLGGCAPALHRQPPAAPAGTQTSPLASLWSPSFAAALPGSTVHDLHDSASGHTWRLWLHVPTVPRPQGGYPVLYVLDGNASFALAAQLARNSDARPTELRPDAAVVVGMGTPGDAPFHPAARRRDYTPPPLEGTAPAGTGGANLLLDFLAREVQPRLEQSGLIDPQRQTLWGHSLGGLLVLHALFRRPAQWSRYAATSPSVWWNQGQVLTQAKTFAHAHARAQQRPFAAQLQLRAGGLERADAAALATGADTPEQQAVLQRRAQVQAERRLVERTHALAQELSALQWPQLQVDMGIFEGLDHGQTLVRGLSDALALAQQPRPQRRPAATAP